MTLSRRSFLGLLTPPEAQAAQAVPAAPARMAMVVDLKRCIGCQACSVACAMENRLPGSFFRTRVDEYELAQSHALGERVGVRRAVLPRLCNHCANPPCVAACPTKATFARPDGVVVVDASVCVGCGYCVLNCPYDARFVHPLTHVADKCTFCLQRTTAGLLPACVETCVGKARVFGNVNDPDSLAARMLAAQGATVLKGGLGTKPHVFYLGMPEALDGAGGQGGLPENLLTDPSAARGGRS